MTLDIRQQVSLKEYTTLKVGGVAEYFADIVSDDDLLQAISFAKVKALSIHVFGGGSNVLVADGLHSGLFLHVCSKGRVVSETETEVLITVQSGEILDEVVNFTVENNWWGIENLSHIPGTVGAAPIQNIGAYGVEIKDCIESVQVFNTETNKKEILTNEECVFGYRNSIFKSDDGKKYIITAVTLKLYKQAQPKIEYRDLKNIFTETNPTLKEIRAAVILIRAGKFPDWNVVGTAGSFFKNPIITQAKFDELKTKYPDLPGFQVNTDAIKIPLGWILDKVLHLKGYTDGLVSAYEKQALVLIVDEQAKATDVENFANEIIKKVMKEVGVVVEWEVTKIN